jgi:hypothetical protein
MIPKHANFDTPELARRNINSKQITEWKKVQRDT